MGFMMKEIATYRSSLYLVLLLVGFSISLHAQQYHVAGQIPIEGAGGWDYAYLDSANHQLYIAHSTQVDVLDVGSQKPVAAISGLKHVHGIAIADELNRGFITDGGDDVVVVFDLKSNRILQRVKAGNNPDGIVYDRSTQRVFACNGRSGDVTAINAKDGSVAGTIAVGGKLEFPAGDDQGSVFVNVEDKSEIVKLDPRGLKVLAHWALKGCDEPSGLAIDTGSHRLFAVCDNQTLAVVDYDSGKTVATVPIGEGPDATAYDADRKLVFSSNGESGTLTVVKQENADHYSVAGTVATEKSARTMALDPATHAIYLPAAKFGPVPAPSKEIPHPRPAALPGSFHLIVVSPI
jgi:DNA-binding beta-propeller fold protein YncE